MYILTDGEYSDYNIIGWTNDFEKACMYAASYDCNIEIMEKEIQIEGKIDYYIVIHYDFPSLKIDYIEVYQSQKRKNKAYICYTGQPYSIQVSGKTKDECLKIARDMRAEILSYYAQYGREAEALVTSKY